MGGNYGRIIVVGSCIPVLVAFHRGDLDSLSVFIDEEKNH